MPRELPAKLTYFLKNGIKDSEDGYEYASELNRILNSDECHRMLSQKEIVMLRDYADKVRAVGEMDYYTEERILEIEKEHFGSRGLLGFLNGTNGQKQPWPF